MSQAGRRWLGPTAFAALLVAVACGGDEDQRLAKLEVGVSRDSALTILGASGIDSTPYIFDTGRFLLGGRDLEVLYYDSMGRRRYRDTVPGEELTPIVIEKGVVTGTGWVHWDSIATALNIVTPAHAATK